MIYQIDISILIPLSCVEIIGLKPIAHFKQTPTPLEVKDALIIL